MRLEWSIVVFGANVRAAALRRKVSRISDAAEVTHRSGRCVVVRQSGSGFHIGGNTAEKDKQRSATVDHLTKHLDFLGSQQINPYVCSLPGELWEVERSIIEQSRCKCVEFVGFEKCPVTFQRSQPYIPRKHKLHQITVGRDCEVQAVASAGQAKLILGDIRDSLLVDRHRQPHTLQFLKSNRASRINRSYHAFWLDSFSPLGSEMGWALCKIIARSSSRRFGSAFALAFMIGRDQQPFMSVINASPKTTPIERRADVVQLLIEQHGRKCRIDSAMTHDSWNEEGSVKIGTVFGTVLPLGQ